MIIDVHTHLVPPRDVMTRALSAAGKSHPAIGEILRACPDWGYRVERKIDEAVDFLDRNAIRASVIFPFDFLGATNDLLLRMVKGRPSFIPFACFDLSTANVNELEATVKKAARRGFRGVKLYPLWGPYSEDRYASLFSITQEMDLPVVVHSGESMFACVKTEWSHPEIVGTIADKYQSLRLIIAHGGHPYHEATLETILSRQNVYTDISAKGMNFLHAVVPRVLSSRLHVRVFDKILFGTDFFHPVVYGDEDAKLTAQLAALESLGLSGKNLEKILYSNARTLYNLRTP
jgi:predicted TIM-barrel fold metal-dependent hydrolase